MTEDQTTEQAIKAAGADKFPRVTPADLQANITSEHYFTAGDGLIGAAGRSGREHPTGAALVDYDFTASPSLQLLTFCVLVLRNGFTVHGVSACVSPQNFNAEIGRKVARENAVRELWPLMGYALRERMNYPVLTEGDAAADLAGTRRPDNHID